MLFGPGGGFLTNAIIKREDKKKTFVCSLVWDSDVNDERLKFRTGLPDWLWFSLGLGYQTKCCRLDYVVE